jgi:hypothetical protein
MSIVQLVVPSTMLADIASISIINVTANSRQHMPLICCKLKNSILVHYFLNVNAHTLICLVRGNGLIARSNKA